MSVPVLTEWCGCLRAVWKLLQGWSRHPAWLYDNAGFIFYAWWLFFVLFCFFQYLNYCKWRWLWYFNVCVLDWERSKWMTVSWSQLCSFVLLSYIFVFSFEWLENWWQINPFLSSYCVSRFCNWCHVAVLNFFIYFKIQSKKKKINSIKYLNSRL